MYAQFQVMIIHRPSISELQAWDMVLLLASLEREVCEIFLAWSRKDQIILTLIYILLNLLWFSVFIDSPSPDKYHIGSQFDLKNDPSKTAFGKPKASFSFGAGREHFSKTVYNTSNMYPDAVVPGPGTYTDGTKLIGVNARKTSLKERKFYLDDEEMALKLGGPGPGQYVDQQALHATGNYASSEML